MTQRRLRFAKSKARRKWTECATNRDQLEIQRMPYLSCVLSGYGRCRGTCRKAVFERKSSDCISITMQPSDRAEGVGG